VGEKFLELAWSGFGEINCKAGSNLAQRWTSCPGYFLFIGTFQLGFFAGEALQRIALGVSLGDQYHQLPSLGSI